MLQTSALKSDEEAAAAVEETRDPLLTQWKALMLQVKRKLEEIERFESPYALKSTLDELKSTGAAAQFLASAISIEKPAAYADCLEGLQMIFSKICQFSDGLEGVDSLVTSLTKLENECQNSKHQLMALNAKEAADTSMAEEKAEEVKLQI